MSRAARLASFGLGRWASSLLVIASACVPIGAAVLFIPNGITSPWGAPADAPPSPSNAEHVRSTRGRALKIFHGAPSTTNRTITTIVDSPAPATRELSRMDTSPKRARIAPPRGIFVPPGETDDSER